MEDMPQPRSTFFPARGMRSPWQSGSPALFQGSHLQRHSSQDEEEASLPWSASPPQCARRGLFSQLAESEENLWGSTHGAPAMEPPAQIPWNTGPHSTCGSSPRPGHWMPRQQELQVRQEDSFPELPDTQTPQLSPSPGRAGPSFDQRLGRQDPFDYTEMDAQACSLRGSWDGRQPHQPLGSPIQRGSRVPGDGTRLFDADDVGLTLSPVHDRAASGFYSAQPSLERRHCTSGWLFTSPCRKKPISTPPSGNPGAGRHSGHQWGGSFDYGRSAGIDRSVTPLLWDTQAAQSGELGRRPADGQATRSGRLAAQDNWFEDDTASGPQASGDHLDSKQEELRFAALG